MALKRFLTAETERRPVVIVVENLELCGSDTINFLQYLAAGMRDHRVAILGTGDGGALRAPPGVRRRRGRADRRSSSAR